MMKRLLLSGLSLLCALSLTACAASDKAANQVSLTLPRAETHYSAPIGDAGLTSTRTITLYIPGEDGRTIVRAYADINTSYERSFAQDIVQALLSYNDHCISGPIQLGLYGQHPVTVSGGVCTVNLTSNALALDGDELYTAALCLSSTLCAVNGINAVNILAADQALGMDISGYLPLGTLSGHGGEDAASLWNSFYGRRTALGSDPSAAALTSTATLFFPLDNATGVICETRSITFGGQTPQQLALGLLDALSAGPVYTEGCVTMPEINTLLTQPLQVSDMIEGGRLVSLSFVEDLEEYLAADGIDTDCYIASLLLTVTSFVPNITAMSIRIGDRVLTGLSNPSHAASSFTGGVIRRSGAEDFPMVQASIYLMREDKLSPVTRSSTAANAASPRALLNRMFQGPTQAERTEGFSAVLPYVLGDSDILGLAIEGDTLLLNLSPFFASTVSGSSLDEQLMCYSMVNTLCEAMGLRRVVFFFDGEQADTLQGTLTWSGEFLYAPGLNGDDRG